MGGDREPKNKTDLNHAQPRAVVALAAMPILWLLMALAAQAETASPSPRKIPASDTGDAVENPFKQDGDSSPECYA